MNYAAAGGSEVLGIPLEFVIFALTLAGVALLHHRTLEVAVTDIPKKEEPSMPPGGMGGGMDF